MKQREFSVNYNNFCNLSLAKCFDKFSLNLSESTGGCKTTPWTLKCAKSVLRTCKYVQI